jgi:phage FluMu protein Com
MDISFTCDKCGKTLVIDEAGAGITIDCPQCGKAVYVTSVAPPKPKESPVRVEPKPLTRVAAPPPAPSSPPRNNPLVPSYSGQRKPGVHPSIEASVHCLLIVIAMEIVGLLVARQNMLWGTTLFYASLPFFFAPFFCAVYGMCMGHVRDGLLVLVGLSVIIGFSYWVMVSALVQSYGAGMQQLLKQFVR